MKLLLGMRPENEDVMFKKLDMGKGHRITDDKNDCQARALATASGRSYPDAWDLLYKIQGERRECAFNLVAALKDNDVRLGCCRWQSFPAEKGKSRMTAAKFCELNPRGSFILKLAHHVAAVEDGVLYDTWNSSKKCVYAIYGIMPIKEMIHNARGHLIASLVLHGAGREGATRLADRVAAGLMSPRDWYAGQSSSASRTIRKRGASSAA